MAKPFFLLGLIASLVVLLPCTIAVDIDDIFTLEPNLSDEDGGCSSRAAALDQWLTEASYSLDTALNAIDDYNQDIRVRRSMSVFFGIANSGRLRENTARNDAVNEVRDFIEHVNNFFNDNPLYNSANYRLFCHSTFLSQHEPSSPALDYLGAEIQDQNGQNVLIRDVPLYQTELAKDADNKPWWAGELTGLNGYFFTEYGGNYCYEDDLGVTNDIKPLVRGANGEAREGDTVTSVILCPYSFDGSPRPNSYREANGLLAVGRNLADAIPKSATLLHEAFHTIHGGYFLAGDDEICE
ncbi:hypothetical protein B0I37DRAFT_351915 [Chaetomium sp. MPI-CAGE-AT-0009]|nr:hypothetical protein B0I37DRAFT_351915 [Chaetomium sp. MPI-CAGE-AT-0009]